MNMKSKFTFIILLWSSVFCRAQYTWHALPAAPISWRFDDFYFLNPQIGWAINPNYDNIAPNQPGRIFKTTDGGSTWLELVDSSNTFYRSVGFADSLIGWVGNLADTTYYPSIGGRTTNDTVPLYQTSNGGITWAPANLPHPHPAGICGISVVTDSVVFAYGRWMSPAGYVKTINKGGSWMFTNMDSMAFGLVDGHFFNADTGFITGMGTDRKAIILYTVNGGSSWSYVYHSTRSDTDRVWKLYFPSRDTGYASIEAGGTANPYNTWFLKTTNGGLTWTESPFITSYDEEGIGFINNDVGWIGGDIAKGTYVTYDGGNTWAVDPAFGMETPPYVYSTGFSINRFRSFGDTLMYASGNTIYKLDLANTGINEILNKNQNISEYPNPATTSLTIASQSPINQVKIINLLGQTVYSHEFSAATVQVNVSTLPSALYFVKVNGTVVIKFVKE